MKKSTLFITAFAMAMFMVSCGSEANSNQDTNTESVETAPEEVLEENETMQEAEEVEAIEEKEESAE
ncbi:MAG: hypothetical protein ACXITV_07425 [Luteibaculaceae bacterium]